MEKKAVGLLTLLVVAATVVGVLLLSCVPKLHAFALRFQTVSDTAAQGESVLSLLRDTSQMLEISETDTQSTQHQLRLELPADVQASDVTYVGDYMNRTFSIMIPNIGSTYFYDFPMVGSADHIVDVYYDVTDTAGNIVLEMDGVYELNVMAEGRYIYLDFPTPHEVYDYVVVIDAGHGGKDGGATAKGINEKDINLAIVLKMKDMFEADAKNIGIYYTRTDDANPTLEARAGLAADVDADLFLSVHNNSTSSGRMSGIHGTEVMYLVSDETQGSKDFAETVLSCLLQSLGSDSKGLVAGDEIYIIRTAKMPVALAEVGFMTNADELALLQSEEYQTQAAGAMVDAIYQTLGVD